MSNSLLLKKVRPWGREPVDVLVVNGFIQHIQANIEPPTPDTVVKEVDQQLLLPGFVDGHLHLDKTLWGLAWHNHQAGPRLLDRIENERRLRQALKLSPQLQAERLIRQAVSRGTTHMRTHVDIDTESGLANFEGVLAAREKFKAFINIQLVAFPQSGLLIRPGTLELVEEALRNGAEVVGGLDPASIDRDPVGHLEAIFGLANRYGVAVDIHLHEPGELGAFQLELIAERTRVLGLQGQVAVSHAFCLGMVDNKRRQQLAELLGENEVAIMTHGPGNREFPPILSLTEAGVHLFTGSDNIRDTWSPFGNADMLERAWILGYRSNFKTDEEFETALRMATMNGAQVMKVERYGLAEGCRADFVVLDGETLTEAMMNRLPRTLVVKRGRVVTENGRCLV
jgi:cytosine/adenosine deaminase-related metal-dependent hydrolase